MLHSFLLAAAAFAPQGPEAGVDPLVINELSYDDIGGDDFEFIEIYNTGSNPVDLSTYTIDGFDGTSTTPSNGSITLPAFMLAGGGYYVIGAATVPNVQMPLTGLSLENGPDAIVLNNGANVVDSVVWEYADWINPTPPWLEGDGIQGAILNHENTNVFNSISRYRDGVDTNDNGCDFGSMPWTPGTSNEAGATTTLPYVNNFDGAPGDTVEADFIYSFVSGTVTDPVALGIPASPGGGNVSQWFDPTGGGDTNWLRAAARTNYTLETYIYISGPDAVNLDVDDGEVTTLGVRGTSDSFAEPNDVGGIVTYMGVNAESGQTGIAWTITRTALATTLYLVDYNDGGSDFTVLGAPIVIVPGVNDGWQRLRICSIGGDTVGNLGGTLGCDDGQRITATGTSICEGGAYVSYREYISNNAFLAPPTLDNLTITSCSSASVVTFGTASPTTQGTPTISAVGLPTMGNAAFSIDGSGLVPSGFVFGLFNTTSTNAGMQIPGGVVGALLFLNNPVTVLGMSNTPAGTVSFAFPVPCNASLDGLQLNAQLVDIDPALGASVPVGTSQGLTAVIGN